MDIPELYRRAGRLHKEGDLDQAESIYRQVLQIQPSHPQIIHRLGLIAYQRNELDRAVELFNEAIQLNGAYPSFHNNLGNALKGLKHLDEAEACYRRAARIDPNYAPAYFNLGALLRQQGHTDLALRACRQALQLDPDFVDAHCELGYIYAELGQQEEALRCFQKALNRKPEAIEALMGLGSLYTTRKQTTDAINVFRRAVQIDPSRTAAYINLGALYLDRALMVDAQKCFLRAVELEPENPSALFNLGLCSSAQNNLEEARSYFDRTLIHDPSHIQAGYETCRLAADCCDWKDRARRVETLVRMTEQYLDRNDSLSLTATRTLLMFPVAPDLHTRMVKRQAHLISERMAPVRSTLRFRHGKVTPGRLRIGYVSPDFREHAVGILIHDLFRHHDRTQFEVFGYALVNVEDDYHRRIRQGCDHFVDISQMSPEAAARRIHDDGIHILIDLAGHTTHSRPEIFALQPVPVQAHYLGYLDTMGADFLPYIIADAIVIPPEQAERYTESIVYLPETFVAASPLAVDESPLCRGDVGLPDDAIVFCCFNHSYKIEPELFDVWARILNRVSGSVLWISHSNEVFYRNLQQVILKQGIDPERLIEAERQPLPQHLARSRLADLFLDTFTYNAGATAILALQSGLPVLTRPGDRFLARMGASLVRAAGVPELICSTTEAYEDRAVYLATHPEELAALRTRLTERRVDCPLFDVPRFARYLENAYRQMWSQWTEGKREPIHIQPEGSSLTPQPTPQ